MMPKATNLNVPNFNTNIFIKTKNNMKNLTFLLALFFLYATTAVGQNVVTINGAMNNTNGDPVPNVEVKIELITTGLQPDKVWQEVTDNNGRFSVVTSIGLDVRMARIRVTYTNCDGEIVRRIKPWTPGMTEVAFDLRYCVQDNVDDCSVVIVPGRFSNIGGLITLNARATGQRPITYEWSTGETTPSITAEPNEKYCVTITDASGCTAEACWTPPGLDCKVDIELVEEDGDFFLVATFNPESDSTGFFWSNGETGDTIKVDEKGRYCVRAVDLNTNCRANKCFDFDPDKIDCLEAELAIDQIGPDSFAIKVVHADSLNLDYIWSTGDSTNVIIVDSTGFYKVILVDQDRDDCKLELSQWIILDEDCTVEIFSESDGVRTKLSIKPGINAQIDSIVWSTGETKPSIVVRADSTAEYCVDIFIGNCRARACIDIEGDDFNADNYGLSRSSDMAIHSIRLFPNPAMDVIQLETGDFKASDIQIFDNSGTLVKSLRLTPDAQQMTTSIRIQSLKPGFYFMNIVGEDESKTLKFIKQ